MKSIQLECEKCGTVPDTIYVIEPWYCCEECALAEVRRQRFEEENILFDNDNAMQDNEVGGIK